MPVSVSVVIPCFNQGKFIDEAVDSVLAQSYHNIEIIIVNDGSTDEETNQLLQNYNRTKTRVVSTDNQGLAAARNNGIKEAEGTYILPLDADDRIGATYTERAVGLLDSREELGIIYCQAQLFGAVETPWQLPEFSLEEMLLDNVIFCSALFRRADWEKIGGYDESLKYGWEDYDFWLSLLEMGRKVYQIPETLFYYRVSADSMVRARPRQHKLETFVRLYHKHQALYSDNIQIWIDKLLDVREQYHEAKLIIQGRGGEVAVDQLVRKVDTGTRRLEFQLPVGEELQEIVFKVADDYTAIQLEAISLEGREGSIALSNWTTNADVVDGKLFVFCSSNPQITIKICQDNAAGAAGEKLVLHLEYSAFGRDCLPVLLNTLQKKNRKTTATQQADIPCCHPLAPLATVSWWGLEKALLKRRITEVKYFVSSREYKAIKHSGLFDPCFYVQNNLHVNPTLVEPLIHYLENGWREGRNPNPLFDAGWYRQAYNVPEDQDPLLHYIEEGKQYDNNPNPLFFSNFYTDNYWKTMHTGQGALSDYLHQGWRQGKNPNPCFDTAYYLEQNPEIYEQQQNPLFHYYHIGNPELRSPMPFFDMVYYCEDNPKVLQDWMFPLLHYYEHGAAEGRSPNRFFDPEYYRQHNNLSDLSGMELFFHYASKGAAENKRPSALFDPKYYAEAVPQFRDSHKHPLPHYQEIGVHEGVYPCREVAELDKKPLFSILTPVFNTDELLLRRCIHSVLYQAYPHWELCLADDGSSAPHIRAVLEEYAALDQRIKVKFLKENQGIAGATNAAAAMATGDYVAFLDHDDALTLDALYEMARAVNTDDPDVLYSDEDLINIENRFLHSFLKPAFNQELLLCHNYITHFLVTRRSLFKEVGGLSADYNGAQDYDLVLKLTEQSSRIHHIPKILYHWRATETSTSINHSQKDYADEAGLQALRAAVQRRGLQADVRPGVMNYYYEVHRQHQENSCTDIYVVLQEDGRGAEQWITEILEKTADADVRFYLIPDTHLSADTEKLLERVDSRVTVAPYAAENNLARSLNKAVAGAQGEFLCFIHQGVNPESPDWLVTLLAFLQGGNIGLVGGLVTGPEGDNVDFIPDFSDNSSEAYHHYLTVASTHANGQFCSQDVLAVDSTFCVIRRNDFVQAGGFDHAQFPALLHDVDLCFRLSQSGFRHVFTPLCRAIRTDGQDHFVHRPEAACEKEIFQSRWQEELAVNSSFLNSQLILTKKGVAESIWLQWLLGSAAGRQTAKGNSTV